MLVDRLQKFMFEEFPVKGSIVHLHSSWLEVRSHAQPPPQMSDLLAETVCASVLLTSNIKFRGSVSLQIQSGGAMGLVLGQCTDQHEVRGVVRASCHSDGGEARQPVLSINLEPSDGGVPYQGLVSLHPDGLAAALEEYFSRSEQLDTRVWFSAGENCCSGLMLQRMPGRSLDADAWNRIVTLASTVSPEELLNLEANALLLRLFCDESIRLFDPATVRFGCKCSKGRVSDMLKSLGENEVMGIIEEQGSVDVRCEYCGQSYSFDPVDAAQLFVINQPMVAEIPGRQ